MSNNYTKAKDLLEYLTKNEKFNTLATQIFNRRPAGTKATPKTNYMQNNPQTKRKFKPWKQRNKNTRKAATPGKNDSPGDTMKKANDNTGKSAQPSQRFTGCFCCGKQRHFAKDCRTPQDKVTEYCKR